MLNTLADHILFTMEFQQMREDFQDILEIDECPACGRSSAPDIVCLANDCDWMLFPAPGRLHPATIPWLTALKERLH